MVFEVSLLTTIALLASIPINYLALMIVDRIRTVDVSWRRRLLLVLLSVVITGPLTLVSQWLFVLIYGIDLVLVRWIYSVPWKDAALRTLIWYGLGMLFGIVFGIVLGILVAIAMPGSLA